METTEDQDCAEPVSRGRHRQSISADFATLPASPTMDLNPFCRLLLARKPGLFGSIEKPRISFESNGFREFRAFRGR